MALVFPIAAGGTLVGSAVVVAKRKKQVLLATSLHLLGGSATVQIAIPPHGGQCDVPQRYPLVSTPAVNATVGAVNPFADLAILAFEAPDENPLVAPPIPEKAGLIAVGSEVAVLGYPFAPLGSFLETWTPGIVTALAKRDVAPGVSIDELVLSNVAHPGSSGSAVIGRRDARLYGIL